MLLYYYDSCHTNDSLTDRNFREIRTSSGILYIPNDPDTKEKDSKCTPPPFQLYKRDRGLHARVQINIAPYGFQQDPMYPLLRMNDQEDHTNAISPDAVPNPIYFFGRHINFHHELRAIQDRDIAREVQQLCAGQSVADSLEFLANVKPSILSHIPQTRNAETKRCDIFNRSTRVKMFALLGTMACYGRCIIISGILESRSKNHVAVFSQAWCRSQQDQNFKTDLQKNVLNVHALLVLLVKNDESQKIFSNWRQLVIRCGVIGTDIEWSRAYHEQVCAAVDETLCDCFYRRITPDDAHNRIVGLIGQLYDKVTHEVKVYEDEAKVIEDEAKVRYFQHRWKKLRSCFCGWKKSAQEQKRRREEFHGRMREKLARIMPFAVDSVPATISILNIIECLDWARCTLKGCWIACHKQEFCSFDLIQPKNIGVFVLLVNAEIKKEKHELSKIRDVINETHRLSKANKDEKAYLGDVLRGTLEAFTDPTCALPKNAQEEMLLLVLMTRKRNEDILRFDERLDTHREHEAFLTKKLKFWENMLIKIGIEWGNLFEKLFV